MLSHLCSALQNAVCSPAGPGQSHPTASGWDQRAVKAYYTVYQVLLAVVGFLIVYIAKRD